MTTKEKVSIVFKEMTGILAYLHDRWLDERDYEDWEGYQNRIQMEFEERIKEFGTFVKTTKRPFGFQFNIDEYKFQMSCTMRNISVKNIK